MAIADDHVERIVKQSGVRLGDDAIAVAEFMIEQLLESLSYLLKVKSLSKHIPQTNTRQLHTLNQQCVAYFYLQGESNSRQQVIAEDSMPRTIPKDAMVSIYTQPLVKQHGCWQLTISNCDNQSMMLHMKIETPYSLSYSLSKGQGSGIISGDNYRVGQFKVISQIVTTSNTPRKHNNIKQRLQQSTLHSHSHSHSIPLTFTPEEQQPNTVQQRQLQHVKKNLYAMRRYRRISIQQQRQSIDRLNKKKSHLLLGSKAEHTYDYDGRILEKRKVKVGNSFQKSMSTYRDDNNKANNSSDVFGNVTELHTSISGFKKLASRRGKHPLNTNKLIELNTSSCFDQLQTNNQSKQHNLQFNNSNKRQVSHLPFISLRDNAKIIQNSSKQLSGCVTQRSSLQMRKLSQLELSGNGNSDGNRRFRFFSQIELQKKRMQKSREKALDRGESEGEMLDIGIIPQTLTLRNKSNNNNPQQEQPYQKRSKMMQKYLKKLTEQKCKIQKQISQDNSNLKSLNFNQLTVPQKYPIQRYYEYDFEGEVKAYEHSISSKLSTKKNSLSLAKETEPNC